jgi:hypothetical protein
MELYDHFTDRCIYLGNMFAMLNLSLDKVGWKFEHFSC